MTSEFTKRGSSCTFTIKKIIFYTFALKELEKSSCLQNGDHRATLLMLSSTAPLFSDLFRFKYGSELNLALAIKHCAMMLTNFGTF